jgi:catechol-2,3-dioxygenase
VLSERGALVGASDHGSTKALYAHDPDGIEFEVSWLVPAQLLGPDTGMRTAALDLDAEIARYGEQTRGGVGVSVAAG